MDKFPKCPRCYNEEENETIWQCRECGCVHCQECDPDNGHCPECGSDRVKSIGIIDTDLNDYDEKDGEDGDAVYSRCPRCYNSEDGESIWRCKECLCVHCKDCDPDNGHCPNCGSSRVKEIGYIDNDKSDDDSDDEEDSDNDTNDDDSESSSSNSESEDSSSSGCFITTACLKALGVYDDSYELQLLRNFRDTYVLNTTTGQQDIQEYYKKSVIIIAKINTSKNSKAIWRNIYTDIRYAVRLIELQKHKEAYSYYKNTVAKLENLIIKK